MWTAFLRGWDEKGGGRFAQMLEDGKDRTVRGLGKGRMSDEEAFWRRQENRRSRIQMGYLAPNRDTSHFRAGKRQDEFVRARSS